jgi:hypothetical protein
MQPKERDSQLQGQVTNHWLTYGDTVHIWKMSLNRMSLKLEANDKQNLRTGADLCT